MCETNHWESAHVRYLAWAKWPTKRTLLTLWHVHLFQSDTFAEDMTCKVKDLFFHRTVCYSKTCDHMLFHFHRICFCRMLFQHLIRFWHVFPSGTCTHTLGYTSKARMQGFRNIWDSHRKSKIKQQQPRCLHIAIARHVAPSSKAKLHQNRSCWLIKQGLLDQIDTWHKQKNVSHEMYKTGLKNSQDLRNILLFPITSGLLGSLPALGPWQNYLQDSAAAI